MRSGYRKSSGVVSITVSYQVPHETLLDNQGWFKSWRGGPGHVVNTCFLIVMLFSTPLHRREVMILKTRMSPVSAIIWGASRMS